jgi:hypothetical protein
MPRDSFILSTTGSETWHDFRTMENAREHCFIIFEKKKKKLLSRARRGFLISSREFKTIENSFDYRAKF